MHTTHQHSHHTPHSHSHHTHISEKFCMYVRFSFVLFQSCHLNQTFSMLRLVILFGSYFVHTVLTDALQELSCSNKKHRELPSSLTGVLFSSGNVSIDTVDDTKTKRLDTNGGVFVRGCVCLSLYLSLSFYLASFCIAILDSSASTAHLFVRLKALFS